MHLEAGREEFHEDSLLHHRDVSGVEHISPGTGNLDKIELHAAGSIRKSMRCTCSKEPFRTVSSLVTDLNSVYLVKLQLKLH